MNSQNHEWPFKAVAESSNYYNGTWAILQERMLDHHPFYYFIALIPIDPKGDQ